MSNKNKLTEKYVKSNVDYHNIIEGDLCKVVEECDIFIKVVKVGMTQVHYLYNFEFTDAAPSLHEVWHQALKSPVQFLASTKSVSAGRAYNDILLFIDGGKVPAPIDMNRKGELAPQSLFSELLKTIGDINVERKDDMIDGLLDGTLERYVSNLFVSTFYFMQYSTIKYMVERWATYGPMVKGAHDLKVGE